MSSWPALIGTVLRHSNFSEIFRHKKKRKIYTNTLSIKDALNGHNNLFLKWHFNYQIALQEYIRAIQFQSRDKNCLWTVYGNGWWKLAEVEQWMRLICRNCSALMLFKFLTHFNYNMLFKPAKRRQAIIGTGRTTHKLISKNAQLSCYSNLLPSSTKIAF